MGNLRTVVDIGSYLGHQLGSYYIDSRHIQEYKMRARIDSGGHREIFVPLSRIIILLGKCISDWRSPTVWRNATERGEVVRFNTEYKQYRCDVADGLGRLSRMMRSHLARGCDSSGRLHRSHPTGTVAKKNSGRSLSVNLRTISDLRRINMAVNAMLIYTDGANYSEDMREGGQDEAEYPMGENRPREA